MLEYWNDGIMGSGKMVECCNGEIHLDMEIENAYKFGNFLKKQHSNIPSFHYSMFGA